MEGAESDYPSENCLDSQILVFGGCQDFELLKSDNGGLFPICCGQMEMGRQIFRGGGEEVSRLRVIWLNGPA